MYPHAYVCLISTVFVIFVPSSRDIDLARELEEVLEGSGRRDPGLTLLGADRGPRISVMSTFSSDPASVVL